MSKREGFTFIEVMVALAITSALLVILIATMNYHLQLIDEQRTSTIAMLLAKETLEKAKKELKQEKGNFAEPYEGFSFETIIEESPYPSVYEVIAKVQAKDKTVVLSEFVQKR